MDMAFKHIYSEKELAATLGLSYWTVRKFRLKLGMPHFRTTGRIFYRLESVKAWMAEKEQTCVQNEPEAGQYGELRRVR